MINHLRDESLQWLRKTLMTEAMTQEKTTRRRGRPSAEETRRRMAEVLQIARREFMKNGYRATTLESIAAAAGVSKRTIYLWHADKAALFLACVQEGAERFPTPRIDPNGDVASNLRGYAIALIRELASDYSFGMGILLSREGRDFPELTAAAADGMTRFLVEPLADYLRQHGLEQPGSTERADLLISMILAEIHRSMLMGVPLPDDDNIKRYAELVTAVFLHGATLPRRTS